MRKLTFTLVALLATVGAMTQTKFWVYKNNDTQIECLISEVDSISFTEPSTLTVSPTTKSFDSKGGQFSISVSSNTAWSVTSNQTWATLSTASGSGDGSVTVTVAENKTSTSDNATITIKTSTKTSTVSIIRSGITEKCKASDYPQVTIGTQTWMAENYRCSRYDTQSEAYKRGRYTIPTSGYAVQTPFYVDASDKSKWSSSVYSDSLTDAHVAKLGYLYNWAAAVGVEDGDKYGTTPFTGNRQGVCPNGWHVPTVAEWQTLYDYIYKAQSLSSNDVGKYLKATSGWYSNIHSTNTYGFSALPAGYGGRYIPDVGYTAFFWTATPHKSRSYDAYSRYFSCSTGCMSSYYDGKYNGKSVRCLRD